MPLSKRIQLALGSSIFTIALFHVTTGVEGIDTYDAIAVLVGFLAAFIAFALMEAAKRRSAP